jgi:hypothetical protein
LLPKFLSDSSISLISPISREGSFSLFKHRLPAFDAVMSTEQGSGDIHTESDLFSGVFHE